MSSLRPPKLPFLGGLMEDPGVDTHDDARMLAAYLQSGKKLPPLAMSIGDPYLLGGQLPKGLAAYERKAPKHLGGYNRTPAGNPEARRMILDHTIRVHKLDRYAVPETDFNLHLTSATGTRGIMHDFGRYVLDAKKDTRVPIVLCASPTWDYAGVFEPLGFRMHFWQLRPEHGWLPQAEDINAALKAIDDNPKYRLAIVAINAQHSPTARSWPPAILRQLFAAATSRGAGILLDDPYYHVSVEGFTPASAATLLLEHLAKCDTPVEAQRLWCRTESFGKAFVCNNWGIGSIMGHPEMLNRLAKYTFEWAFHRESLRQWAMAHWLNDPMCEEYLSEEQAALKQKRTMWAKTLRELGWPVKLTPIGEVTPYYLVAVPPKYASQKKGVAKWRQLLMDNAGMLLSYASIEQAGTKADAPYLRALLSGSVEVVAEAIRRLQKAGIRYEA